ncbi:MAG: aspartyl/asparaginyl beta-hydroxylase domain-containing protein [Candidatus Obscuribacterales bacterium]|nr:aspartyl/asparaginyl beta-hydroxylase domain-containing protein [Candidatus Obscuribacterales bacterium]
MLAYISQLKTIGSTTLDSLVSQLKTAAIDWSEPYPEYASDGLKVATLLNPTGQQNNFDYRDCENPAATPLLKELTKFQDFFQASGLQIMGSRLLRLDPGTFLHEHRDFVYLEDRLRLRLHLPLITNDQAFITTPGKNIHFKRGYLWKLDPKATVHSACNFGSEVRIHLMLDCYDNQALRNLVDGEDLDEDCQFALPLLDKTSKNSLLAQAQQELDAGRLKVAEEILLRSFCQFNLGTTTSYDLLFELFQANQAYSSRIEYWQERLKEVYMDRKNESEMVTAG